ncbi:hypothetical protein WISP_93580 [Willisornis vidua]|uniref:CCHC-type domain-containing protein n=1 Tax=Willisornis vidua TaxID=1566151 RepID=A0ABQ9D0S2_9PASS|nr:hypothetical protein WISP_93580 [Willisornis vidua]
MLGGKELDEGEGAVDEADRSIPIDEKTREKAKELCPIVGHVQAHHGEALQAPLQQRVGNTGPLMVKVQFSITDLLQWKTAVGSYQENPDAIASIMELIIKTQNPDWQKLDVIMYTLFDSTERKMIQKTAMTQIEMFIAAGTLQGSVGQYFPLTDPGWDPNDTTEMGYLVQYRKWVLFGIRTAIPKETYSSKLNEVKQDRKESPTDFLNRLREAARKYSTLDPETEHGKILLIPLFVNQSWDDIRIELQKVTGPELGNLDRLLDKAWVAYRNRYKKKERRDEKIKALLKESTSVEKVVRGTGRERGRGRGIPSPLGSNQCAYCKQEGHWKRECPALKQKDPRNTLMAIDMA